jgi:23S rRNA (guanosine2251-2'-O)-methyltransferase
MNRIIYGVNPVLEALKAGNENLDELIIAKGRSYARVNQIISLAHSVNAKIRYLPREQLTKLTGTENHQGVAIWVGQFRYLSCDEFLEVSDHNLVVMLDSIQDPHNLGAIARTALASGAEAIIIPKDRSAQVTPAAIKVSAGALERLPVVRVTNLNRTAEKLKDSGFWLLGTDNSAQQSIYETADLPDKLVVVIGSEGKGISRSLKKKCDITIRIPMAAETESLNASAAAAVILFELVRRRYS